MDKMWMTRDAGREPILVTKEELAQENLEILKIVKIVKQNIKIGHTYCRTAYVLENGEIAYNWGEGDISINTNKRNNPYSDFEMASLLFKNETLNRAGLIGLVKTGLVYFDKETQVGQVKKYTMIDEQLTDSEREELIRIEIEKNK